MKAALPPDQRALLTAVSGQTELLNSAANEIIDLHQIMQKKFRKVAIKFDPSELAFECAEAITFSVIYSPIEIVVCCQPSVPKFIRGDARFIVIMIMFLELKACAHAYILKWVSLLFFLLAFFRATSHRRLKQIILNLAWNAVKSTTVGFVRINVSASSADAKPPSEAVTLHIAVVDSGRGIAASDLSMLFQSWQQINPANELSENVRVSIFQLHLLHRFGSICNGG